MTALTSFTFSFSLLESTGGVAVVGWVGSVGLVVVRVSFKGSAKASAGWSFSLVDGPSMMREGLVWRWVCLRAYLCDKAEIAAVEWARRRGRRDGNGDGDGATLRVKLRKKKKQKKRVGSWVDKNVVGVVLLWLFVDVKVMLLAND